MKARRIGVTGEQGAVQFHDHRPVTEQHPVFADRGPEPHRDLPSRAVVPAVVAERPLGERAPAVVLRYLD